MAIRWFFCLKLKRKNVQFHGIHSINLWLKTKHRPNWKCELWMFRGDRDLSTSHSMIGFVRLLCSDWFVGHPFIQNICKYSMLLEFFCFDIFRWVRCLLTVCCVTVSLNETTKFHKWIWIWHFFQRFSTQRMHVFYSSNEHNLLRIHLFYHWKWIAGHTFWMNFNCTFSQKTLYNWKRLTQFAPIVFILSRSWTQYQIKILSFKPIFIYSHVFSLYICPDKIFIKQNNSSKSF